MKRILPIALLVYFSFLLINPNITAIEYDLTIVGRVGVADGLNRIPITLIDMLKEDLRINHVDLYEQVDIREVRPEIRDILLNTDKTPGNVSLLVDGLWSIGNPAYTFVPESHLKIAYSMLETDGIPSRWVQILNHYFDAVVVPDSYVLEAYKNSGVTIPLFELPLCLYLDEFLNRPQILRPRFPFVFGCNASGVPRKNQSLLIQAFAEEFGNCDDVILKISSRWVLPEILASWNKLIQDYKCKNIILEINALDNSQYIENMSTFDCYVNISKGEGFSIGPREALAMKMPCILSNNSAQKAICRTGLVRLVPAEIPEPPCQLYVSFFGNENFGSYYNCKLDDVKEALRDVYNNYDLYLESSKNGPKWASQYRLQKMKAKYLNLIKPKVVLLGNKNEITDDYLMTTSEALYNKYSDLISK